LIIGITSFSGLLLLAPPYGVTAYLSTFMRESEFSKPESIVLSYLAVILSTEGFHFFYGYSVFALLLNVFVVSAFISFTKFKHPPAIALTIFSYIFHAAVSFVLASVVVLAMIVSVRMVVGRVEQVLLKGA
jgi:hypothetical protein